MDSLHFDIDARVGLGLAAGEAGAAREIGIDRDELRNAQ